MGIVWPSQTGKGGEVCQGYVILALKKKWFYKILEWQRFWYQKNQLECIFQNISITLLVWLVYNSWVLIPQFPGSAWFIRPKISDFGVPKSVQTAPASVMPDAMRDFLDIARHPNARAPWTVVDFFGMTWDEEWNPMEFPSQRKSQQKPPDKLDSLEKKHATLKLTISNWTLQNCEWICFSGCFWVLKFATGLKVFRFERVGWFWPSGRFSGAN